MDQREEPQEEAPPSNSRDGNHDYQSKAQRNQPGPESGSSSVSFRSDRSKRLNPDFKDISSGVEQIKQSFKFGPGSGSSCVSFRSDRSKHLNPDFKDISSGLYQKRMQKSLLQTEKADSVEKKVPSHPYKVETDSNQRN